jgi:hypothetical protein
LAGGGSFKKEARGGAVWMVGPLPLLLAGMVSGIWKSRNQLLFFIIFNASPAMIKMQMG